MTDVSASELLKGGTTPYLSMTPWYEKVRHTPGCPSVDYLLGLLLFFITFLFSFRALLV